TQTRRGGSSRPGRAGTRALHPARDRSLDLSVVGGDPLAGEVEELLAGAVIDVLEHVIGRPLAALQHGVEEGGASLVEFAPHHAFDQGEADGAELLARELVAEGLRGPGLPALIEVLEGDLAELLVIRAARLRRDGHEETDPVPQPPRSIARDGDRPRAQAL